jgi:orotate phosphoribosyltransferase
MDTVFAEKDGDDFKLDRLGFKKTVNGRKVWVVEDIATTGQSAKKTAEVIEAAGGKVIAFSFIWNRNPEAVNTSTMGAPVLSLITEPIQSYVATEHPMWGIWPVVSDIGHGHPDKFPDYSGPRINLVS